MILHLQSHLSDSDRVRVKSLLNLLERLNVKGSRCRMVEHLKPLRLVRRL